MTALTTTPLQSKFGPIVADAAGTITVVTTSSTRTTVAITVTRK